MLSVLIVDDQEDMRVLLSALIRRVQGCSVAGEAIDGEQAVDLWRSLRPDVVVMDNRMPGISGLEAAERILAEDPSQPIYLFTAFMDEGVEQEAKRLGLRGCFSKERSTELIDALRDA